MVTLLERKVVVVTGAGGGIGRGTCEVLARHGAQLVVTDIDQSGLDATCSALDSIGQKPLAINADLSSPSEIKAMIDRTISIRTIGCGIQQCRPRTEG